MSDHPDIRKLIGHLATLADATGNYMLAKAIRTDFGAPSCDTPSEPSGVASSTDARTSTRSPSSPEVDDKAGVSGAVGSADTVPFVVEGHPNISAKYRVKRLGTNIPYTAWGTYDQADRDRNMLACGWRTCEQYGEASGRCDNEECCSNCGRCCCNRLCERCKMPEAEGNK